MHFAYNGKPRIFAAFFFYNDHWMKKLMKIINNLTEVLLPPGHFHGFLISLGFGLLAIRIDLIRKKGNVLFYNCKIKLIMHFYLTINNYFHFF